MEQEKTVVIGDVRQLGLFAQRNIKLVLGVVILVTLLGIALSFILPARYAGTAIIMADQRKANLADLQSVLSDMPGDNAEIRSQMDIIKSSAVLDRVIKDLDLLHNSKFNPSLTGLRWFQRLFSSSHPADIERQQQQDQVAIEQAMLGHLSVDNDGRSYSIMIRYTNHDPDMAAKVANALADEYLVDQLEVKYDMMQRANAWLEKRLEELRSQVSDSEKAVEDFKTAHNLVGIGDETITQKQMDEINSQLLQARAERSQAEARLNSVKNLSDEKLETSSIVLASPLIQELKQQEATVRRNVADLATRYGDRHPKMIDARNELASIREKITEEIRKMVAGLQNDYDITNTKVQSLKEQLDTVEAQTDVGNQAMVTLRQLQREADAERSLYEGFLNRSKQVTEQQNLQVADARVIARAQPALKPYFPSFWLFSFLSMALGLVLGFALGLLLEYLDRGLRALGVIEETFHISGLGLVPIAETAVGQSPTDYALAKPLSAYAESIRAIRTAIHFSNVDQPPRVIMITSSFPHEGKTVFACSFARLLAKSGSRVLLIDADMRRPHVHSLLRLDKSKPDLAKVLAKEAALSDAVQRDPSGADVVIARASTPNPQDLLHSQQMKKLLETARASYDMIIIDTPPVIAVSDCALVAQLADATVYVIRWAKTPREAVGEGLRLLSKSNIKIAGAVLTQVDLGKQGQYGLGDYGHYYRHYKSYYAN